jgi:hypothetical protein
MAEQIISPGVFTRENDLSFLPAGVAGIGAAIIGPTQKGPAFVPTVVTSFSDFENRFGGVTADTYVPLTVQEYLQNAGSVTVVRILAGGGYTFTAGAQEPVAVLAATRAISVDAIDTTDMEDGDGTFSINVPAAAGGVGTAVSVITDDSETTAPVGEGANAIAVGTSGLNNSEIRDQLIIAINGGTSFQGSTTIQLGTAGASAGVQGVSASAGTTSTKITLEIKKPGFEGNGTVNVDVSGNGTVPNTAFVSGSSLMTGLIYPAKSSGTPTLHSSTIPSGSVGDYVSVTGSFATQLVGVSATKNFSSSINPNNENYIYDFIGSNADVSVVSVSTPDYSGMPGYSHLNFRSLNTSIQSNATVLGYNNIDANHQAAHVGNRSYVMLATGVSDAVTFDGIGKTEGYGYSSTPYIQSQLSRGRKDLFRFHTLNHGKLAKEFKISITNLQEPPNIDGVEQYSKFDVVLRHYNDTDGNFEPIETWPECTLDPTSTKYICKQIGDRYPEYNETLKKVELKGNYPNLSPHIRVEVVEAITNGALSPKLSPKGFAAVKNTYNTGSLSPAAFFPSASYEYIQSTAADSATYNASGYLGFKFAEKEPDNDNFLLPLPNGAADNCAGYFNVEHGFGHTDSGYDFSLAGTGSLSQSIDITGANGPHPNQLKFTVPFQGGDDGLAPWTLKNIGAQISSTNLHGFDLSSVNAVGYKAYKKALDILSNQDQYDINMLVMPGVLYSEHSLVVKKGIDLCETRGDAFYVMDLNTQDVPTNTAVSNASGLDTSYAATYYPWVKVQGANGATLVPPSVIVPGAIAQSDAAGAEWFAPAGLNRGVLGSIIETRHSLTQAERDVLYQNKINPIATFPGQRYCIWGQKTLQERSTALDRINVRRLLITIKKYIASSSKYLVFEQNTLQTRTRFLNIVNPYLEMVQQQQGLYAFRVVMDESNNTPTVIDRNQLVGAIYLQPTKTAEFIVLDFNVLPTGATFDGGGY